MKKWSGKNEKMQKLNAESEFYFNQVKTSIKTIIFGPRIATSFD